MTNLDIAHWRPEHIPPPPNEPPAVTALWIKASEAMERADRAEGWDFNDRRARREALDEVYATLRTLRRGGAVETRKSWAQTHKHRANGRPQVFGRRMKPQTMHG